MAIYHLEAKVISRGAGRSAVAAAAYMSCSRITNEYDGVRGLTEQPTVHEGVAARAMERQGFTADRCELNRQIRADNAFLRELRQQVERIARFDYTEDKEIQQVRSWVRLKEKNIDDLRAKETQCEEDFQAAQTEFTALSDKAKEHDPKTLWPHRLTIRKDLAQETAEKLKAHFGGSFSQGRLRLAEEDVKLNLEEDERSLKEFVREKQREECGTKQYVKPKKEYQR